MVRTKKDGEKPQAGATLSIDVDSFVRTRDSVVTGLATLQDAIQTLSSAYIKHTNAVLGEHGAGLDVDSALSSLANNPLMGGALGSLRPASPPKSPAVEAKKEKKKRVHDPNAPKRPLTPYFLYMQTARPIIAGDLGPEVAKGAVSTEGVRRWNIMNATDKQLWTNAYTDNLRLYNARMQSYKNGNFAAKDMSDEEALAYAEQHNVVVHPEPTADGQLAAEALIDAPGEDDDDVQEVAPVKATKAKAPPRNRKSGGAKAPQETIVPPAPIVPQVTEKEKSPDKKRKRSGKKADEPIESVEKEAPAKKSRKSKGKGDA